jgi:hypothetical protein
MGGWVSNAIRFASGEVVCINAHTNPTPFYFKSTKVIIDHDEAYLRDYIAKTMSEDPINTAIPLAPSGYGMNVIDLMTGRMLVMQGYCGFDEFSTAENSLHSGRAQNFVDFVAAGRIVHVHREYENNESSKHTVTRTPLITTEKALALSHEFQSDFMTRFMRSQPILSSDTFEIVFEPTMVYEEFEESSDGAVALHDRMLALGFEFDADAELVWKEWLDECRANEGEDDEET